MSAHYSLDTKHDLDPEVAPSAQAKTARSLRRKLAYGALALWLLHAGFAFSSATAGAHHHESSLTSQVTEQMVGWKDWVKWHCKPLPKDPKERALALLTKYPIIGKYLQSRLQSSPLF